jgi:hypothetical protein
MILPLLLAAAGLLAGALGWALGTLPPGSPQPFPVAALLWWLIATVWWCTALVLWRLRR